MAEPLLKEYAYIRVLFDSDLFLDAPIKAGWNQRPVPKVSQLIGDQWAKEMKSPVLRVPSVILPDGNNYLINVNHSDFDSIKIGEPVPLDFDPRLKNKG